MNFFSVGEVTVVVDLAHNEAGLEALLEIMTGVRRAGGRSLLGLGAVGDRQDDLIERLGEIGAMGSDVVAICHKERYLRGRTVEQLAGLLRAGAERVGVPDVPAYATEVDGLAALVGQADPGDVVGLMCHAERPGGLRVARRARRHVRQPGGPRRQGACRRADRERPPRAAGPRHGGRR